MTIVLTGGGSGGHITPILAVAAELKKQLPDTRLVYIGQRGDRLSDIPAADPSIDAVYSVSAGKFRRYKSDGIKQIFDLKTQALNVRDLFRILAGIWQSFWLLRRLRPELIFTRGGFVSVPVAVAGRLSGIPYITHDSDALPSLANRLIASGARLHAVALPAHTYPYPQDKIVVTGVPVSQKYQPVTAANQAAAREKLEIARDARVLLVTGGGNGAAALNHHIVTASKELFTAVPALFILHVAGRDLADTTAADYDNLLTAEQRQKVRVVGFTTDLHLYSEAADVVVARGGATNLAEFAIQGKACLIIPSPQLHWNVVNARVLAEQGAVEMLSEKKVAEQGGALVDVLSALLNNADARQKLAANITQFGQPTAAKNLADVLISLVRESAKQ